MRKILSIVLGLALVLCSTGTIYAKGAADNSAGAVKVKWNLSGAVMPVPPYGLVDIPGSDTASKLIVNQPNGKVEANLTGVMNGLNPNTEYTVFLSNGYTKYTPLVTPNVVGTYTWLVLGTYAHDLFITTQNPDGTFTGTGGYPAGGPYQTTENVTGQVVGTTITFTVTYLGPYSPGYSVTVSGTIAPDGSMSGTLPWEWHTTSGAATLASGSTGWPGLFTNTITPFTFTTDAYGAGSWHVNLKNGDFPLGLGTYTLSVWINGAGGTMLVSDVFQVVVK